MLFIFLRLCHIFVTRLSKFLEPNRNWKCIPVFVTVWLVPVNHEATKACVCVWTAFNWFILLWGWYKYVLSDCTKIETFLSSWVYMNFQNATARWVECACVVPVFRFRLVLFEEEAETHLWVMELCCHLEIWGYVSSLTVCVVLGLMSVHCRWMLIVAKQ